MSKKFYVDIQSAIDALCTLCCYYDYCGKIEGPCRIRERLLECTADVAPIVRGEWAKTEGDTWRCSECGELSCCHADFCPNCGAEMRKENE